MTNVGNKKRAKAKTTASRVLRRSDYQPKPRRQPTQHTLELAAIWLRVLRDAPPEGLRASEIEERASRLHDKAAWQSLRRARDLLQDQFEIEIPVDSRNRYSLLDPNASLPLVDPTSDDVTAVVMATSLLAPIVDQAMRQHLERLVADIDAAYRTRNRNRTTAVPKAHAITSSFSSGQAVDPKILASLSLAAGRNPVRISYAKPWSGSQSRYTIEPWQLRVHDGALYLRAYSRKAKGPRTFRVVQIQSCTVMDDDNMRQPLPAPDKIWAEAPAFGLDEDRPDTAVLRIAAPFARWVHAERWHPEQRDAWVKKDELLERTLPYRSCRELARRVLTLGDSLVSIEPPELAEEVRGHAVAMAKRLGAS